MAFNPNEPFEVVTDLPQFDPSKPFEPVVEPSIKPPRDFSVYADSTPEQQQLADFARTTRGEDGSIPPVRPDGDFNLSPFKPEESDWLGVGEEVRGFGRALKRGGRRFKQSLDVTAMRQGDAVKSDKTYAEAKSEYDTARSDFEKNFPYDSRFTLKERNEAQDNLDALQMAAVRARDAERFAKRAGRAAISFSKQAAEIEKLPETEAQKEFAKAETPWWHFFKNPFELSAVTLAESAPVMAATVAAAPTGPVGVAAVAGLGSWNAESSGRVVNAMSEAGVDLKNPEAVMAWFADKAKSEPGLAKAGLAALGPAAFDALTAGLAGTFLRGALGQGKKKILSATVKEMALQMAGGGAGSVAGSAIAKEPIDWKDVVLEVAGEFAPGEAFSNVRASDSRRAATTQDLSANEQFAEELNQRGIATEPVVAAPAAKTQYEQTRENNLDESGKGIIQGEPEDINTTVTKAKPTGKVSPASPKDVQPTLSTLDQVEPGKYGFVPAVKDPQGNVFLGEANSTNPHFDIENKNPSLANGGIRGWSKGGVFYDSFLSAAREIMRLQERYEIIPGGGGSAKVVDRGFPGGAVVVQDFFHKDGLERAKVWVKTQAPVVSNPKTVTAYRGTPERGTTYEKDGRTFWTDTPETAKEYGDNVEQKELQLNNPLETDNWMTAKRELKLPANADMSAVLTAAEQAGFDSIIWKHHGKTEYVLLRSESAPSQPIGGTIQSKSAEAQAKSKQAANDMAAQFKAELAKRAEEKAKGEQPTAPIGEGKAITPEMSINDKEQILGDLIRDKVINAPSFPKLLAAVKAFKKSLHGTVSEAWLAERLKEPWGFLSEHSGVMNAKSARAKTLQSLADAVIRETDLPMQKSGRYRGMNYRVDWDKLAESRPKPTQPAKSGEGESLKTGIGGNDERVNDAGTNRDDGQAAQKSTQGDNPQAPLGNETANDAASEAGNQEMQSEVVERDLASSGKVLRATNAKIAQIFSDADRVDIPSGKSSALGTVRKKSIWGNLRAGTAKRIAGIFEKTRIFIETPEGALLSSGRNGGILARRILQGSYDGKTGLVDGDVVSRLVEKMPGLKVVIHDFGDEGFNPNGTKRITTAQYRPASPSGKYDIVEINSRSLKNYNLSNPDQRARLDAVLTEELLHAVTYRVSTSSELSAVWKSLTDQERKDSIEAYGKDTGNDSHNGAEYVRMVVQERLTGKTTETHDHKWRVTDEVRARLKEILNFLKEAFGLKPSNDIARQVIERIEGAIRGDALIEGNVFEGGSGIGTSISQALAAFYSRLTRTVEQSQQGKASGAQWKATIKNSKLGANMDEMALVGVNDLEDGKTYTKQEVLDYLKANEVVVKDVTLGVPSFLDNSNAAWSEGVNPNDSSRPMWTLKSGDVPVATIYKTVNGFFDVSSNEGDGWDSRGRRNTLDEAKELGLKAVQTVKIDSTIPTHFESYQLPGAKKGSYREILLTVPEAKRVGITPDVWNVVNSASGRLIESFASEAEARASVVGHQHVEARTAGGSLVESVERGGWKDGHSAYNATKNPIVRIRLNERQTADGKKLLFLEEIQPPQKGEFEKMPALFQKNWREIAFKFALRMASENGFDSIGWTTGTQQAERYSLEKQVEAIYWDKNQAAKTAYLTVRVKDGGRVLDRTVPFDEMEGLVGKEVAKKIIESPEREGKMVGDDLKIGGEGLKKLYDVDFRNVVNNLPAVKKAGQKVGTSELGRKEGDETWTPIDVSDEVGIRDTWIIENDNGALLDNRDGYTRSRENMRLFDGRTAREEAAARSSAAGDKIHSLELSPAIRESVMGGQALFTSIGQPLRSNISGEPTNPKEDELLKSKAFKANAELADELGIIAPQEDEAGVPTKVGDVYDMVLSRPGLNAAVREASVSNASNALNEAGLKATQSDDGLFQLVDETKSQEVAGQKLVSILEREIQSARADNRPERIANLLNTVVVHLARDKNKAFSQELKNKLYYLAQGERSSFGRALGGLAMWGRVLANVAQNPKLHLDRIYSDAFGGDLVRRIMDRIASNFQQSFTGAEIERLYNANPKLRELFDNVVNRLKVKPSLRQVIDEIFATPIYKQEDLVNRFVDTMVNKFSATPEEAAMLKAEFSRTFSASFAAARKKAQEQALKSLTPQEAKVIGAGTPLWKKITNLVNAGGFGSGDILTTLAKERGWTVPSEAELAQMQEWSAREQRLREPTQRQLDKFGGDLAKATKEAEVGTEQERIALIKKMQATWSRWSMPVKWFSLNPEISRNRAKAINEFVGANLLLKLGFLVRQAMDVGITSMPLNAINRSIVHIVERAQNNGGFSPEIIKDMDAATREMVTARISSIKATIRQMERTATGHTNRRVLDRMAHSIGIFERMAVKADGLEAKGNIAGARAVRLATILQAGYRVAAIWDSIQSVGLEWQEMRQQLSTDLRAAGKSHLEITTQLDDIFGSLKVDMREALKEAEAIGTERGLTKDKATLQNDAWNLIKAKAYDRMRKATANKTDYQFENEQLRELHSWNLPETGGIGGLLADTIKTIRSKTEKAGVPTGGLFSFGNAIGIAANRMATFSGGGLLGGWGFGTSPWYQGERNIKQRRIEAVEGLAVIGIMVALAAAGKALVQVKYPDDKDEKERFIAEGHKLNTIRFVNDDGSWFEAPIQMSPFSFVAPPIYMIGGIQRLLTSQARAQAKLDKDAARTGAVAGKAKGVSVGDVASVLAQGAYGFLTGGRTAGGAIQSFSDYGNFNLNKSASSFATPYIPALPAWQEAARMMGAAMDTRTATMAELLVPSPWSGHQRVNSLGDPLTNPDAVKRVVQVLTGGYSLGSETNETASSHAYQQLFAAGYSTPEIPFTKGFNFDGTIRPMTPQEREKYTVTRGKAFKQELMSVNVDGLPQEEAYKVVQQAYQRANDTALGAISATPNMRAGRYVMPSPKTSSYAPRTPSYRPARLSMGLRTRSAFGSRTRKPRRPALGKIKQVKIKKVSMFGRRTRSAFKTRRRGLYA